MPSSPQQAIPRPPTYQEAFRYWLKLGFISFGGPAGQIAILHEDLVVRKRWISEQRFLHALNFCMLLPGPEAQQLAIYIGWLLHRSRGGITAGLLFILPSLLFILVGLSWLYLSYGQLPALAGILYGIKPAVTAMVLFAAWRIGSRILKNGVLWAIATLAFLAIFLFQIPFPVIVLGAALIGSVGGRLRPALFSRGESHGASQEKDGQVLIDDQTPPPQHARYSSGQCVRVLLIGLTLWGAALGGLCARYGWEGGLTQMGWFFTKAALLTFGGAYAVLPYVYQAAVEHYHWLTPVQMMDGLALGETTPGPLIMVVTFVGFVSGWTQELFGSGQVFLAGLGAALVVTFFTFLPSFIFILAGGPLIEATHGTPGFTAPLTAITAAVVGVILNLALFFAGHVLWPEGLTGHVDGSAAAIGVMALWALVRNGASVVTVIVIAGALGWVLNTGYLAYGFA